jgi:hypothetical protein
MVNSFARNPNRNQWTACLAIGALLIQLLAPLVHYGVQPKSSHYHSFSILCSSLINVLNSDPLKDQKQEKRTIPSCPVCQAFHLLNASVGPSTFFFIFAAFGLLLFAVVGSKAVLLPYETLYERQPRGPPSILAKPI